MSSPPTSSSNLTSLTNDSQSFCFLEYFLRLTLHASTAKVSDAWEVSNPHLTMQFEKRSKNALTLDAWVDLSTLPEGNTEDEILKKGFNVIPNGPGIKFSVGRMKMEGEKEDGAIRRKMMLCKVAVGRSYNATEDFAKIAGVPEGYDSFVLDKEKINFQKSYDETSCPSQILEYVIKDTSQILPTFIVNFEFDMESERKSRQKSLCDNCEMIPAAVFCQADSANLCNNCDSQLHSSKLTGRHTRVPLEAGPQTFSACRQHSDKTVEFFCPTCSRPVCVHCKMVGHHSTGDAARHKLITVAEAFRGVSECTKANDPILEARKQKIESQKSAVVERVKAIEANAAEVQQQLEEVYKRALADLKNITKKKLNVLKGDMVELHREIEEIKQLESFLEYQKTGGHATQFILDWAYHQKLRGELHSFQHFRENIDVHPDIKVNGAIQVLVESTDLPPVYEFERQGSIIDPNRPRYTSSPSRLRNTPTVDFSSLTRTRRPDYTDIISSVTTPGKV